MDKSLLHSWLDSYETWSDLRDLENRNGMRWLTHESDDGRYGILRGGSSQYFNHVNTWFIVLFHLKQFKLSIIYFHINN